jgi:hypothetical protein
MDPLESTPATPTALPASDHHGKLKNKPKISQARLEANRRNAQKCTGPRTPEGKAISRQNALKHGLSGAGVVLHPEDRERLKVRLEDWTRDLDPQDSIETWLVGRAALASIRLDRCATHEQAKLDDRLETASDAWHDGELRAAAEYAERLETQPRSTLEVLMKRAAGCEWLVNAWVDLGEALRAHGHLNRQELSRMLRLLGELHPPQAGTPLAAIWAAAQSLLPDRDAAQIAATNLQAARATLNNFMKAEFERLRERTRQLASEGDGDELNRAHDAVLFDASDDAQKMARYEKANSAEVHKCLNLLFKKRREEARWALSQDDCTGQANRVAQAISASNGHGHEPFVMPQSLSERMGEAVGGQPVEPAVEPAPQFETTVTVADVLTPEAFSSSDDSPGAAAPAAPTA